MNMKRIKGAVRKLGMKDITLNSHEKQGEVLYNGENNSRGQKRITLLFLGSTGAGPVYSLEMAKALVASGQCQLQCVVSQRVSNIDDWVNSFRERNVKLEIVDTYKHSKLWFAISLLEFWKVKRIVKTIRIFQPDVLYVPFLLTWDFLLYPRLYKKMRIIATLHDPHPHDVSKNLFAKWINKQNKQAYKYVNDVVILNNSDVQYVRDNYCPNVHVIPHASFSSYVKDTDVEKEIKHTIGFLGRIEPYKGLDLLIEAFEQLDNKYKLIVAGSGKIDETTYKKIVENDRIELINRYIEDDEFTGLINRMDFVLLPYKRASQSGVIPLVFAHGKSVVATNVGALQEQVPENTGRITEPIATALAQAIKEMYEAPAVILEYGKAAKAYADRELTWESSAKKVLDIVNQNQ